MSLINKEILPFTAQAYDPKNDEFKEVSQDDLKGSWALFASIQLTSLSYVQLN